jgi:LmbE family N-acetylglucosaminyl deacetylase
MLGNAQNVFTARAEITHAVNVRAHLDRKRAALHAHASQTEGGGLRTAAVLLKLPGPLFAAVGGREWLVERGRSRGPGSSDEIFRSLR